MPPFQSKECLMHSKRFWCKSRIFYFLFIGSAAQSSDSSLWYPVSIAYAESCPSPVKPTEFLKVAVFVFCLYLNSPEALRIKKNIHRFDRREGSL